MPEFLERWKTGAKVVVGIRTHNSREGVVKRYGSKLFYGLFSRIFGLRMIPGSTDYRLIDREVQQQFIRLSERRRITRGLIDWLGYPQEQIKFAAKARTNDAPGYSVEKLFHLAIDSMVSMSISPLYIAAYIGFVMLPLSIIVGIFMVVDALIGDPLHLNITGSGYVVVILLLLVSVLLISQGIIGLYLSHIHTESQNRPLYVIDRQESVGIDEK
jgi:dolichol-phosphate mannosyltransferase